MVGQYWIQGKSERTSTDAGTGNADVGRNVHFLTNLSLRIYWIDRYILFHNIEKVITFSFKLKIKFKKSICLKFLLHFIFQEVAETYDSIFSSLSGWPRFRNGWNRWNSTAFSWKFLWYFRCMNTEFKLFKNVWEDWVKGFWIKRFYWSRKIYKRWFISNGSYQSIDDELEVKWMIVYLQIALKLKPYEIAHKLNVSVDEVKDSIRIFHRWMKLRRRTNMLLLVKSIPPPGGDTF